MRIGDGTAGEEGIVSMFGVWRLVLDTSKNNHIGLRILDT